MPPNWCPQRDPPGMSSRPEARTYFRQMLDAVGSSGPQGPKSQWILKMCVKYSWLGEWSYHTIPMFQIVQSLCWMQIVQVLLGCPLQRCSWGFLRWVFFTRSESCIAISSRNLSFCAFWGRKKLMVGPKLRISDQGAVGKDVISNAAYLSTFQYPSGNFITWKLWGKDNRTTSCKTCSFYLGFLLSLHHRKNAYHIWGQLPFASNSLATGVGLRGFFSLFRTKIPKSAETHFPHFPMTSGQRISFFWAMWELPKDWRCVSGWWYQMMRNDEYKHEKIWWCQPCLIRFNVDKPWKCW